MNEQEAIETVNALIHWLYDDTAPVRLEMLTPQGVWIPLDGNVLTLQRGIRLRLKDTI